MHLNIKNNTCNGKCSQCAECCGFALPLTKKEVKRIRQAIKDNNITFDFKDFIVDDMVHMQCPLLDMKTHKCKLHMINPALKPEVCKRFICSNTEENLIKNINWDIIKIDKEFLSESVKNEESLWILQKMRRAEPLYMEISKMIPVRYTIL